MLKKLVGIATLVFLVSACGNSNVKTQEKTQDTSQEKVKITISAAASLTDVVNELKANYEKDNNVEIITNYGSSGTLQNQIAEGADVDIFFSAGDKQMDNLSEKGLIYEDSREELLKNEVVLIVSKDSNLQITGFENVQNEVENIAISDPESVPVGQYSKEIFTNLGNWEDIQKIMLQSQDVRQSLDWVTTGNANSGIVYRTDAYIEKDKVKVISEAPQESHKEINYPIAIIERSKDNEEVKKFYEYLISDDAKGIYENYGFGVSK